MAEILQDPITLVLFIILLATTIPAIVFWVVVLVSEYKKYKK